MNRSVISDFVSGLGDGVGEISRKIREEDSEIYKSESYIVLIKEMAESIAVEFHETLSKMKLEGISIDELTLEDGISKFMEESRENTITGYLIMSSEVLCDSVGASYLLHGISAFCALFFIAKKDLLKASQFINLLMQPTMAALRIDDVPRDAGRKGGRPEHPRKEEALKIGRLKWEQMEYASINVVAATVKHQLEKKYTDAPSISAIKKWLTESDFRPERSVK
ncbi:hypothetical protein R1I42_10815 [Escherichia coli]|uniref:hypothetical protein n=1 Tax=Escherichia coli TaxID=562 RepID=UPI002F96C7DB